MVNFLTEKQIQKVSNGRIVIPKDWRDKLLVWLKWN